MKVKTFKYVDKDRMVPALVERREFFLSLATGEEHMAQRLAILDIVDEIDRILEHIEVGLWDWQPSQ